MLQKELFLVNHCRFFKPVNIPEVYGFFVHFADTKNIFQEKITAVRIYYREVSFFHRGLGTDGHDRFQAVGIHILHLAYDDTFPGELNITFFRKTLSGNLYLLLKNPLHGIGRLYRLYFRL